MILWCFHIASLRSFKFVSNDQKNMIETELIKQDQILPIGELIIQTNYFSFMQQISHPLHPKLNGLNGCEFLLIGENLKLQHIRYQASRRKIYISYEALEILKTLNIDERKAKNIS